MRYIDIIRTLIRNASEKDIPALDWDEQQKHLSMIKARIDDVEVVVRCKDCRFAEKGTDLSVEETDEGTPRHYIDWIKCHNYDIHKGSVRYVGYDDYCSWGERKGGDDE